VQKNIDTAELHKPQLRLSLYQFQSASKWRKTEQHNMEIHRVLRDTLSLVFNTQQRERSKTTQGVLMLSRITVRALE